MLLQIQHNHNFPIRYPLPSLPMSSMPVLLPPTNSSLPPHVSPFCLEELSDNVGKGKETFASFLLHYFPKLADSPSILLLLLQEIKVDFASATKWVLDQPLELHITIPWTLIQCLGTWHQECVLCCLIGSVIAGKVVCQRDNLRNEIGAQ